MIFEKDIEALNTQGHKKLSYSEAVGVIRGQISGKLEESGVMIVDKAALYAESTVTVGKNTVIYPNVYLEGTTVIGENCTDRKSVV